MPQERHHRAQSDAFRIEYAPPIREDALRDDIEYYLAEYRFGLPKKNYVLHYSSLNGEIGLRDTYEGERMVDKGVRAIKRREQEWRNTDRERAELLGIQRLEKLLAQAADGDTIFWESLPGTKEEGYDDYGFVYAGEVLSVDDSGDKILNMTAYRISRPTLSQSNQIASSFAGESIQFTSPEEFLATPFVVSANKSQIEKSLQETFHFHDDPQKENIFQKSWHALKLHVEEFISYIRQGLPKEQLIAMFESLENYAITLRDAFEKEGRETEIASLANLSFYQIIQRYNYEAPRALGSCGATGGSSKNPLGNSADIFSSFSSLQEALRQDKFHCPNCHKESTPPVGEQCPKCNITLQEWAEQGGKVCK